MTLRKTSELIFPKYAATPAICTKSNRCFRASVQNARACESSLAGFISPLPRRATIYSTALSFPEFQPFRASNPSLHSMYTYIYRGQSQPQRGEEGNDRRKYTPPVIVLSLSVNAVHVPASERANGCPISPPPPWGELRLGRVLASGDFSPVYFGDVSCPGRQTRGFVHVIFREFLCCCGISE